MSTEKNKNVIITKKSREKLVKARAGAIQLPKIVGMVFGDGGVDVSGNVIPPTESQSGLTNEIFRKELDGYSFPADTTCRYECTLTASLRERKSARSACTTQKVMWSALRLSSGKARMMMSSRPTRWMIFSKECLRGKETA